MEHPILFLSLIFEAIGLGDFAHHNPHVLYSWFTIIVLIIVARLATRSIQMVPGPIQNVLEVVIENIENFQISLMGEKGRSYFPVIATIFIYILIMNLLGLVPGFLSPTANINTTLSMALVVFVITHYAGLKNHGAKYIKHFMGPMLPIAPLMIPIEIIGHFSRVLSLTLRLWGNIMGEDLVLAILLMLGGKFFVPLPMMFMAVFTSAIQAFVFMLLAMLYIGASLEHAH